MLIFRCSIARPWKRAAHYRLYDRTVCECVCLASDYVTEQQIDAGSRIVTRRLFQLAGHRRV